MQDYCHISESFDKSVNLRRLFGIGIGKMFCSASKSQIENEEGWQQCTGGGLHMFSNAILECYDGQTTPTAA